MRNGLLVLRTRLRKFAWHSRWCGRHTRRVLEPQIAYHPWLIDIALRHKGDALDVGCGDGLLVQRATERLAAHRNVGIELSDFDDYQPGGRRFDVITFVASLHRMDLRSALTKARGMLTPTGEIAVVALSANKSLSDWAWAAACMPAACIGSRLHGETRDIGVVVTNPGESLSEIRQTAADVLPGASVRRALYYRYLMRWANG